MKYLISILILFYYTNNSFAQNVPPFKSLRYDEDYSFLKGDTAKDWYGRMKYTPLSKTGNTFMSYGGDIRFQYFYAKNEDWGEAPEDRDGYILTRYLVHADLQAGKYFRIFVQLQSSLANGKETPPSPVDENQLDLHQAFFDIALPLNKNSFTVRIGRQELLYGSQRLVAVRDGPNNRQSFDAAKLVYSQSNFKAELFFSHYVRSKRGIFDDDCNKDTKFWGAYFVNNKLPLFKNIDLYYLGLWKRKTSFDDGIGKELRHSIGSRIWSNKNNFRYDIEGLYQFGSFDEKNIAAWTFSVNTGYKVSNTKLKPELGLKTEWISGDAFYDDKKLQTFNPLFPRGGYFGLASLIGPINLFDIHPSLAFELKNRLFLNIDYDIFWRYSKNDGIYTPGVFLIYSGKNNPHKFIGTQLSTDLVYTPNNFLYFRCEFTWFDAGDYLKAAGTGKDIIFIGVTTQLKF